MAYAKAGRPLYYQAPMDQRATRFLPGSKQTFAYAAQGRTIRLWPGGSIGRGKSRTHDPFNADSKHLDRFSHPAEQKVESSGVVRERGGRVMSRRQPSLPGFPDIPDTLEIRIPNMPQWEQIGGDMDPGAHGGTIAMADGDHIELLKIQPVREYIGDKEAAEVGFPFWTKEAWFDLNDLDLKNDDVRSALDSIGIDLNNPEEWFSEKSTPEQRALTIATALLDYGRGDEGPAGWSEDIPDRDVKWSTGRVAPLQHELSGEDDEFKDDVLGYSEIRENLEQMVEQMADQGAAGAWSALGDQAVSDAEDAGYDPNTLVGVAEFGDAVGVNGDIETDKTLAGVESDLEKDGYEMLDGGGKVPSVEEMVSPEHAIRAVAKEMDIDEDVVEKAAEGIDWWPKRPHDEIASSTSGYAYVYGKKDPHAHVEDGDYVVQGAYADGTIVGGLGGFGGETFSLNDEAAAIAAAKKLLRDPTFEGDYVTVITRDGELVWDSRGKGNHNEEARQRRPRASARRRH